MPHHPRRLPRAAGLLLLASVGALLAVGVAVGHSGWSSAGAATCDPCQAAEKAWEAAGKARDAYAATLPGHPLTQAEADHLAALTKAYQAAADALNHCRQSHAGQTTCPPTATGQKPKKPGANPCAAQEALFTKDGKELGSWLKGALADHKLTQTEIRHLEDKAGSVNEDARMASACAILAEKTPPPPENVLCTTCVTEHEDAALKRSLSAVLKQQIERETASPLGTVFSTVSDIREGNGHPGLDKATMCGVIKKFLKEGPKALAPLPELAAAVASVSKAVDSTDKIVNNFVQLAPSTFSCEAFWGLLNLQDELNDWNDFFHRLANDPPDANYTVLAKPTAAPVGALPGPPVVQALAANASRLAGLSEALLHSIERGQGAVQARNAAWALKQFRAARAYADQLSKALAVDKALHAAAEATLKSPRALPGASFGDKAARQYEAYFTSTAGASAEAEAAKQLLDYYEQLSRISGI